MLPHVLECEKEGRALPQGGFDPDAPAVALDDLFTQCQANAGARILTSGVQALKDLEDTRRILWGDTKAVVAYSDPPHAIAMLDPNMDGWGLVAPEFKRVTEDSGFTI